MVSTPLIRELIVDKEKTKDIRDAIADGVSQYGMQTFDQCLLRLYHQKLITLEEALRRCTNPDDFQLKLKGISSTSDISRQQMEDSAELTAVDDTRSEESPFDFSNQSGT